VFIGWLAGCAAATAFVAPAIPAEIQAVLDDPSAFTPPADAGSDPNATPVEDPNAVDGCWARALSTENAGTPVQAQGVELWHFDAAAGAVTYELYARDVASGLVLLSIFSGTFNVPEAGVVTAHFESFQENDPATGQLQALSPDQTVPEATLRFNRDGDRLLLVGHGTADSAGADQPVVYQRLDCP
jgi:hypothetical protein